MPKGLGYSSSTKTAKIRHKKHRIKQKNGMGSKGTNRNPKGSAQNLPYTK